MLTHTRIWAAIDALAERNGLTASGLARRAGLDATTFNKSKRQNDSGHFRWPSTESIAKALAATETRLEDFMVLLTEGSSATRKLPLRAFEEAAPAWFDADNRPSSGTWDEIVFPSGKDRGLFALEIRGQTFAPHYRDGDVVILSPSAELRRGDRVYVLGTDESATLAMFGMASDTHYHLTGFDGQRLPPRPRDEVRFVHRIIWVSQ